MKEIEVKNPYRDKGHHCKNLLIRCMDFRFHRLLDDSLDRLFAEEGGFGDYDSPGIAGGASKSIIDPISCPIVFSAIDIAKEKHGIERVVIVDHIDCGAYGGSSQFADASLEEEFHRQKLFEAAEIIKKSYPNLKIALYYQDFEKIKIIEK